MRKPLIAGTLFVAGVFGAGLLIGGVRGPTLTAAAGGTPTTTQPSTAAGTAPAATKTPHADGQVTAVNGNTITVKADADRAGSNEDTTVTTIILTGSTQYSAGHDAAATSTKPAITVGSYIVAEGTLSADGQTLTASQVSTGGGAGGPHGGPGQSGGPHADGTVTAVNGDTITIKADADRAGSNEPAGVTTVILTSTTTYDAGHDSTATTSGKASIVVGSYLRVEGTVSADGKTVTASQVSVMASAPTGGVGGFH